MVVELGQNFRNGLLGFQLLLSQCARWSAQYFHCEARAPKRSAVKNKTALQIGFDLIKEERPRTNMRNRQTEWTEMEIQREGGPIFGWSAGLVKGSLSGYSSSNVFVVPTTNFFLTLHDLNAWFLHDILAPLLSDIKTKNIGFHGLSGDGQDPCCSSKCHGHTELSSRETMLKKSCPPFDSVPVLTSYVESLVSKHAQTSWMMQTRAPFPSQSSKPSSTRACWNPTVERWTTSKFVLHQLHVVCDNKVNEAAEPEVSD